MASPARFNSKSPTIKRILREANELTTNPSPDFHAAPLDSNLFDWHFTLRGPPGSAFSSGLYHGRIVLPAAYPLRPPAFRFLTPSGRFEANREICLSISGHHEETWQPAWGVRTALVALRSFMVTEAKGQLGGLEVADEVRRELAERSRGWTCATCAMSNDEVMRECERRVEEKEEERRRKAEGASGGGEAAEAAAAAAKEVEVPPELRVVFRDELSKEANHSGTAQDSRQEDTDPAIDSTSQETSQLTRRHPPSNANTSDSLIYPHARPAQTVPQPTGTSPTPTSINGSGPNATAMGPAPQRPPRRASNDGVPLWLDRAILVVAACLVVMLLKMLFDV